MPQLIKPNDVKVLTKDGEVKISISLDLNINLNDNKTNIKLNDIEINNSGDINKLNDEKTIWQIPDFSSGEKINFGK